MGNTLCGEVKWLHGKTVYRVRCYGASGSMVKVTQDDEYLAFCEVEVLGERFYVPTLCFQGLQANEIRRKYAL